MCEQRYLGYEKAIIRKQKDEKLMNVRRTDIAIFYLVSVPFLAKYWMIEKFLSFSFILFVSESWIFPLTNRTSWRQQKMIKKRKAKLMESRWPIFCRPTERPKRNGEKVRENLLSVSEREREREREREIGKETKSEWKLFEGEKIGSKSAKLFTCTNWWGHQKYSKILFHLAKFAQNYFLEISIGSKPFYLRYGDTKILQAIVPSCQIIQSVQNSLFGIIG